jgi:hypothetical protein
MLSDLSRLCVSFAVLCGGKDVGGERSVYLWTHGVFGC